MRVNIRNVILWILFTGLLVAGYWKLVATISLIDIYIFGGIFSDIDWIKPWIDSIVFILFYFGLGLLVLRKCSATVKL